MKTSRLNALFIVVILGGFFLRFLFPLERVFHFDQEQIAVATQRILSGHLTLIGPLANTIGFFTGPLIYYLAAAFYWLVQGHPLASTLVGVGIYLLTAISLWWLLRRLTSPLIAVIFTGIYSLSTHLVVLDRITWDPNLSFLSAGLVLIGLLLTSGKLAYFIGFMGMWLAYQAHFAGFVLAVEVVWLSLWLKRWRFLLFSLGGMVFSLLPTFIFDLRHDWLNLQGLLGMITNPNRVSSDVLIYQRFFHAVLISLENLTKIIIPILPRWSLVGLGALILGFWFKGRSSIFNRRQRIILLVWIFIFPLVVMFYRGSTPEYYYLMQLPAFIFILTDLFLRIRAKVPSAVILFGFFLIALGVVIQDAQTLAAGPSLNNKLKALEFIKKNQVNQPVELVLDMEVKDRFGWNYLIEYLDLPLDQNPVKTHLIFPINPGAIITAKFGGIGVWLDKRGEVDAQAFVDDIHGTLFYYPNGYWHMSEFERILYPQNQEIKIHNFAPPNKVEILFAYIPKNSAHKYFQVLDQKNKTGNLDHWQSVSLFQAELTDRKTLTRERKEDLFIFSFPADYTWEEAELFLSRLEGF